MLCSAAARGREVLVLLAVFALLALPKDANAACPSTLTDCQVQLRWDLDNLDIAGPSIPILMTNTAGVAGMQFTVTGAPPSALSSDVIVFTGATWRKAVSPTSGIVLVWHKDAVELGTGTNQSLFTLTFQASTWTTGAEVCLTDLAFSDGAGQGLSAGAGPGTDACIILEPNQPPTFTSEALSQPAPEALYRFDAPTSPPSGLGGHLDATDRRTVFANAAGETVHWADPSADNRDMAQDNPALMPSFQTNRINGLPTIRFRSGGDFLPGNYTNHINRPYSVIGISHRVSGSGRIISSATGANNWLLGQWNNRGRVMHAGSWVELNSIVDDGNPTIYGGTGSTGATQFFVNGGLYTSTGARGNVGVLSLGGWSTGGELSDSEVGEVLIYESVLSANNIEHANLYMAAKWDIDGTYHYAPTSTADSSGNGHTAGSQQSGGLTWDSTRGAVGSFQSAHQRFEASPAIGIGADWTVGSWFRTPLAPATTWRTLTRGGSGDHQIIVSSGGLLGSYKNAAPSGFHSCGYGGIDSLAAGWHHIAAVGSGTGTRFFIDGTYVCTSAFKSTTDITAIGNHVNANPGQRFSTHLDDFAVYNSALSDEQVAAMAVSSIFVNQGDTLSYDITTNDANSDTVTINGVTVPSWGAGGMNLTSTGVGTANLTGTPGNSNVGSHPVLLRATDGIDTVDQAFTVVVANVNDTPTFTATPGAFTNIPEDSPWSFNVTSTDIDQPYGDTWSITLAGPAWLAVVPPADDAVTITGTPLQAHLGANNFTLTVTDAAGAFTNYAFTLNVTNVNDLPVVTPVPLEMTVAEGPPPPPPVSPPADGRITSTLLNIFDEDAPPATSLTVNVTAVPTNGVIERIGGGPVNSFTYDDILNNRMYYWHDSFESTSDSFSFTVTDGIGTTTTKTFSITILKVNDIPTYDPLQNSDLTLDEGASATITGAMLKWEDADRSPSDTITYTVTSNPSNGTLNLSTFTQAQLDAGNVVVYSHSTVEATNEDTSDQFSYTINDGSGSGNMGPYTFDIVITPQNDAPTQVNNGPMSLDEGDTEPFTNALLLWNDVDLSGDTLTYTVTSPPANGTLNLGNSWTQADVPTLTYEHDGLETTTDSFTYTVNDGAGSGNVAASGPFVFSITPQNDEPTQANDEILVVDEGATEFITSTEMQWDDEDIDLPLDTLTYTVTTLPTNGSLNLTTFTQAQIDAGNVVSYTHDDSETTSDSFVYQLGDGTDPPWRGGTFFITVTPVNESPTLNVAPLAAVEFVSGVNAGLTAFSNTELNGFDWESPTTAMTYTIGTPPNYGSIVVAGTGPIGGGGQFTQFQVDNGDVSFQSDGSEDASTTFTVTLDDGPQDGGPNNSGSKTVTINIAQTNDPPTIGLNPPYTALEGLETDIENTDLRIDDVDPANDTLTLTLESEPTYGQLRRNGVQGTVSLTVTQQDIDDGLMTYLHGGIDSPTTDSFVFSVSDGNGGSITNTVFSINVTPQPDPPVLAANSALAGVEAQSTAFTTTNLRITDDDSPAASTLLYRMVSAPAEGDVKLSGGVVGDGQSFSHADVVGGLVTYQASSDEPSGPITFTFRIEDGTFTVPTPPAVYTFTINVAAVDDNPFITLNTGLTVDEGASEGLTYPTEFDIYDEDTSDLTQINIFIDALPSYGDVKLSGATLGVGDSFSFQDVIDNKVTYQHNDTNDAASEQRLDSFDVTVDDAGTPPAAPPAPITTIFVNIDPINDAPLLAANTGATVPETQPPALPRAILQAELEYTDVDRTPTDTLTYTLVTEPSFGVLNLVGVGNLSTTGDKNWTQADINAGPLRSIHDGVDRVSRPPSSSSVSPMEMVGTSEPNGSTSPSRRQTTNLRSEPPPAFRSTSARSSTRGKRLSTPES